MAACSLSFANLAATRAGRQVYLTFDDGPTPEVTEWVLQQLDSYDYKATFFIIGENADRYPKLIELLRKSPHSLGSHTYNHLNGWHTKDLNYLANFEKGHQKVGTLLFRPPYGRIRRSQARPILKTHRIIMWDIVSADFDTSLNGEACAHNVIRHLRPGSILVFHDSHKAWSRLKVALPKVLQYLKENAYNAVPIEEN
ncbi:MAG: polysaccharide deacetylase family protein [Owenweeksia sp.]|nr:polysaccharide deacetylase family protein [Owenweeksia sp.]